MTRSIKSSITVARDATITLPSSLVPRERSRQLLSRSGRFGLTPAAVWSDFAISPNARDAGQPLSGIGGSVLLFEDWSS